MDIMKIKTEKIRKGYWRADFIELGGSPDVGQGRTEAEAVACLFIRQKDKISLLLAKDNLLYINNKLWESGSTIDR
jgi:hypothetical protein